MIGYFAHATGTGSAPNKQDNVVPCGGTRRRSAAAVILAVLLVTVTGPCGALSIFDDAEYELGRGLSVPNLNLTLSGYTSLRLQNLNTSETRFDVRDLSLIAIWDPHPRWRLFTEMELENTVSVDNRGLNASDAEAELERIYVDFVVNDMASLRGGKFLTPFGRWNLLHADPLVWTVSRPLVTTIAVPDHATGAALHGLRSLNENTIEYHLYVDDSDDLDPHHGKSSFEDLNVAGLSNDFNNALGLQLRYHFLNDQAEIGASFASFEIYRGDERRNLFGVDALYRWRRAEFSMESAYRLDDNSSQDSEWGAFVQAVVPIVGRCYAVARIEYYSSDLIERDAHRTTLGLAYRPIPVTSFKLEYHDGSDRELTPDGWEASWSILF
jgi:hypothetical protein